MAPMSSDPSDWKEKAIADYFAREKRQEAAERKRLLERGEVSFDLIPADDTDFIGSAEFSTGVATITDTMKANDVSYSQRYLALDGADAVGGALPEFTVVLRTLGPPAIQAIGMAAAAWVHARFGRKVRLKIGDFEAEVQSLEEVEKALQMAQEYKAAADKDQTGGG